MPTYRIGPLVLDSRERFPELIPLTREARTPAWTFRLSRTACPPHRTISWFHEWTFPDGRRWLRIGRCGQAYVVRFTRLASFAIDPDRRAVHAYVLPDVPIHTIRHLLLDQVVPMLIGDGRHLVIHASAVISGAGAIAFVGPSGSGKSTLAAALARRGCPVITDDCLVVDLDRQPVQVVPTYSGLRLWPDAIRALCPLPVRRSRVAHYSTKRRLSRGPGSLAFRQRAAPLRAACVLDRGDWPSGGASLRRLSGHEAFAALLRCTFHLDVGLPATSRGALERVAALLDTVPVFRLRMPRGLSTLAQAAEGLRQLLEAC